MEQKIYRINGKTYSDIEDLPDQLRSLLKDANDDGTPDIFEGASSGPMTRVITNSTYEVNGIKYSDIDQIPDEFSEIKEKFREMDKKEGFPESEPHPLRHIARASEIPGITSDPKPIFSIRSILLALGFLILLTCVFYFTANPQ